jgi:MoaA/NifB/PqqE/SkfB family radical SAM enzyme
MTQSQACHSVQSVNCKSFCVLPWIHINLNPDGRVTLCCQSHDQIFDERGRSLNAQTHSLSEIWNSSGMRDIRRRMADGEQLPHCKACFHDEAFGRTSYRKRSNELWLGNRPEGPTISRMIDQSVDGSTPLSPSYFDLRLGNVCNLKCTACKPLYSSQIERDPVHAPWIVDAPYTRLTDRFGTAGEWFDADGLVDEMVGMADNLAMIQLAGGEPTINKSQIAFLRHLRTGGRAPDIDLIVVTNLIAVRQEIYDLFAQFKSLFVIVSADGCGSTYDYVRYPGRWPTLVKNVLRLREVRPDARIRIDVVLQAINALNVVELFEWADEQDIPIELWVGRGLDHYNDFRILPHAVRDELNTRFERFFARKGNRASAARHNVWSVLSEMQATDISDEERRNRIVDFMRFVNDMDASRQLSFKSIAPETFDAVAAYAGRWDERTKYA